MYYYLINPFQLPKKFLRKKVRRTVTIPVPSSLRSAFCTSSYWLELLDPMISHSLRWTSQSFVESCIQSFFVFMNKITQYWFYPSSIKKKYMQINSLVPYLSNLRLGFCKKSRFTWVVLWFTCAVKLQMNVYC